jgi:hypothetical protein
MSESKPQLPALSMQAGRGLQITSVEELNNAAKLFLATGLFGDNEGDKAQNIARACVKIMAGAEIGLTPFFSMKNVYIIQGKGISYAYQLIALLIKRSGKYNYKIKERIHNKKCTLEFVEKNPETGKWEHVDMVSFGEEDAKQEQLFNKSGYQKYPDVMYFSRALTRGANMHCADLFGGSVYAPADFGISEDEIEDKGETQVFAEAVIVDVAPRAARESGPSQDSVSAGEVLVAADAKPTGRPGEEVFENIHTLAISRGWSKEELDDWCEPFLGDLGVDVSSAESLLSTWTFEHLRAVLEYLDKNPKEAK